MFSPMISYNVIQYQTAEKLEIKEATTATTNSHYYSDGFRRQRRRRINEQSGLKKLIFNQIKPPELRLVG